MKTKIIVSIGCISIFLLSINVISVSGYEDNRVSVYGYFTWQNEDGSWNGWVNTTNAAKSLNLKIGQPVKCKIIVIPHQKSWISISLMEPGPTDTKTFDVVEGANEDEHVEYYTQASGKIEYVDSNDKIEYSWTLHTNDRWVGGQAPLNAYWYTRYIDQTEKDGYIGFTEAYIENAQWNGPTTPSNDNKNTTGDPTNHIKSTPGFEFLFMIIALSIVLFVCQSWIWKRKL